MAPIMATATAAAAAAAGAATAAARRTAFRVATYNVLSSHLASPDFYQTCNPSNLDQHTRLQRCMSKLDSEVALDAVICLQEVSQFWVAKLHVFFEERGYSLVVASYGHAGNGYMGVGIAWPRKIFDVHDVDIARIATTRRWPVRRSEPDRARTGRGGQRASSPTEALLNWFGISSSVDGGDQEAQRNDEAAFENEACWNAYEEAQRRHNMALSITLGMRGAPTSDPLRSVSNPDLVVATYHMPCVFWAPKVMVLHTSLLFQHVTAVAKGLPFVVAGDFNFAPDSPCYRLVTSGGLEPSDAAYPCPSDDDSGWSPSLFAGPIASAYAAANGSEPDFTNFAKVRSEPEFVDTLDFIFFGSNCGSKGSIRVKDTLPLPARSDVQGPLPTALEPSDHILIAASMELQKAEQNPEDKGTKPSS